MTEATITKTKKKKDTTVDKLTKEYNSLKEPMPVDPKAAEEDAVPPESEPLEDKPELEEEVQEEKPVKQKERPHHPLASQPSLSSPSDFDILPEGAGDDFGSSTEVSREHIMNRMWEEDTKKFHTEIHAPHGMATFEDVVEPIRQEFGDEVARVIDNWIDYFKTDMVAFNRKRAQEMVEMMKAEAQRETARLQNKLLNELAR